jgi:circadian clock protein KaiC
LPHLDGLLGGGFAQGSTTTLIGPSGVGKTLLCLQFLAAGVARGERCVYLGFYEGPQRLIGKAEAVSIALADAYTDGRLIIQWQPAIELAVDELAATALATVKRVGASRIVIDGVEGFRDSALRTERFGLFLNALLHQLREASVTTLLTEELPLYADPGHARGVRVSALTENLMLLRYAEMETGLRRMISVVKQRESAHDTSLRELVISSTGLDVIEGPAHPSSIYSARGLSATLQPRRTT